MQNYSEKPQDIFQTKGHVGKASKYFSNQRTRRKRAENEEIGEGTLYVGNRDRSVADGKSHRNGLRPYGLGINMATMFWPGISLKFWPFRLFS